MKTFTPCHTRIARTLVPVLLFAILIVAIGIPAARAGIAYGSINNFDTVNDTGVECHGFEIEIEDCHSTDITYTYNYNHYGVCSITEDNSVAGHPLCVIRWASKKNTDGSWAAYTAVPSGPVSPTNGHMFTNPGVNFGGEHFGVGYRVAVGPVRYHWLIDDGTGNLVSGGAVQVSTPTFTYYPPVVGVVGQVQAEIQPPEPAEAPEKEFGEAVWVKEIRTTTHNNSKVKLRDLVSDDPADADDKNWRNGEPDEVEVDWELLQTDGAAGNGGKNGKHVAAGEDLPEGNEVVTRRYEFFKYAGPLDPVTGEALADAVGADGLHGSSTQKVHGAEVDYSNIVVVGDYAGAQMAAVDVAGELGLIEHVSEGKMNLPYTPRTLVITGALPAVISRDGPLPGGMAFDTFSGVLSGTPTESGEFVFKINASDGVNPDVERSYTLRVAAENEDLPASSLVDTTVSPLGTGTTTGDGSFVPGSNVTVTATALAGFRFKNWTDNGTIVSVVASYDFVIDVNHSLVANFITDLPRRTITTSSSPVEGGATSGGGTEDDGTGFTLVAIPAPGYTFTHWSEGGAVASTSSSYTFIATADRNLVANFTTLPTFAVTTGSAPSAGGATTGGGSYLSGSGATVTASASPGYFFMEWSVNGAQVSTSPSYTFPVTANRALVASFLIAGAPRTIVTHAGPAVGGSTAGGGNFLSGDTATVVAAANPGYVFSKWKDGNSTASTSPSYTFTVSVDRDLTAQFDEAFVVGTRSSPAVGGATDTDKPTYQTGDRVRATAYPADGFVFSNWTEDGNIVSTEEGYSFDATGNRTLVANFVSTDGITIATTTSHGDGCVTTGEGVYGFGEIVTVSASPGSGHVFVKWSENGAVVSEDPIYSFAAGGNRSLVAIFLELPELQMSHSQTDPGVLEISWPATAAGWVLEQSGNLSGWESCTLPVTAVGGQNKVSVACDGACRYFRLAHAP